MELANKAEILSKAELFNQELEKKARWDTIIEKTRSLVEKDAQYQTEYLADPNDPKTIIHNQIAKNIEKDLLEIKSDQQERKKRLNGKFSNGHSLEIPPELLKGLESMKAGAIPMMITRKLESFLTEQGLFDSGMKPEDAWRALQKVANGEETLQETLARLEAVKPAQTIFAEQKYRRKKKK